MRKLSLSMALAAGLASTLSAQAPMPWRQEIGIRSTFGQLDVNDTKVTLIDLPAGSGVQGFGSNAGLYFVAPVGARFAIEPSLGLSDLSLGGASVTMIQTGARVLYSAWRGVYLAAGPNLRVIKANGQQEGVWGGQIAAGYRFNVGGAVSGRAEVFYESVGKGDNILTESSNTIGLAIGLGLGLGESAPRRGARRADAMWDFALGVQGGYSHLTSKGNFDMTALSLPGGGSNIGLFGFPITTVAPWFVQIPVGEKIALEPSVSYHRYDIEDGGNGAAYELGLRANYALDRRFYIGAGVEQQGLSGDDFDGVDGIFGAGVAAGIRYPLFAGLKGRTELTYRGFFAGDNSILDDYTVTGISFAVTAPLK